MQTDMTALSGNTDLTESGIQKNLRSSEKLELANSICLTVDKSKQ